jgi:hypothetical protein
MRHIKKFESFENRPEVSKSLSKLGEVAKSLRFSTQDSTEETIVKPTTQPSTTPQEPITRPWRPVPTQVPKPGQKERPMGMMKSYEEFMFSNNPAIAEPDVDTPTAPPATPVKRPWRPIPTKVPKPGQQEKPMGDYKQMIDRFFGELKNLKDDKEVQQMIKNIHNKYAKS